jgi:serine/threonine protein kinase
MAIQISIAGYDSFEQIALGGMAAVYKARKTSIDKIVAIKVLFPYLANDQSFIERFQREAKSAAKVQHESIVNVVDFGESDGSYFIVMEYYEGLTLAELLKENQKIPLDIAVSILLDVCLGLEAAHAKEIVHRDIKPANIIYTRQGGIKIADFGLAKKSDTMTVVTQPGKVLGTPAYMSPEQAAADHVGPQSDIFSLGVVAYELFCGRRPFEGKTYSEVLERIQTYEVPPIINENPLIQPDLETVIRKMLEKDLTRRYQNIADVVSDLERSMEKFDMKRDRRRLRSYIKDPLAYEHSFKEKMLSRCLSQGSYYMQKGKTHIEDAVLEFKKILYLDPTNDRARKNLARILSEYPEENSTLELDNMSRAKGEAREKRTPERSEGKKPPRASAKRPKTSKRSPSTAKLAFPLGLLVILALALAGWKGWPLIQGFLESNSAPLLSAPARLTVAEGETVEFGLNVVDGEGDSTRLYAENLPQGASLSPSGDFSWKVRFDQAGSHALKFYADDGSSVTGAETMVEVVDTPLAMSFEEPGRVGGRVGKTLEVKLRAESPVGENVEYLLEDPPKGMEVKGDRIRWRPSRNQTGTHKIQVSANDGIASANRMLVVRIDPETSSRPRSAATGRLEWVLPKLANIYVDGSLKVREDTYLSIDLPEGRHTIRAELMDGLTAFEEAVTVRGGRRTTLDPPKLTYGRLSAYFLGGVGELHLNGKKLGKQPPFTSVVVPAGKYTASCRMVKSKDSREFEISVLEGQETVIEYEVGKKPVVTHERIGQ